MGTKKTKKLAKPAMKKKVAPVVPIKPNPGNLPKQPVTPAPVDVTPLSPGNYDVADVLNLLHVGLIDIAGAKKLLGLPETIVKEQHPVAVTNLGAIGTLQLYDDGKAMFIPEHPMVNVKTFADTKLKFTIEPESLQVQETDEDTPAETKDEDDLQPEDMKH